MIFLTFLLCVLDNETRSRYPKDYNHLLQPSAGYEQTILFLPCHCPYTALVSNRSADLKYVRRRRKQNTKKNINSTYCITAFPFFQPKRIVCLTRPLFTGSAHGMLGPTGVSVFCKIQVLANILHLRGNVLKAVDRRTGGG